MAVVDPDQVLADTVQAPERTAQTGAEKVQYLLTRQGLVQEGIMEVGDKTVYVRTPRQKGGITISRLDVLCIADTKEELFEYRKLQIRRQDTGELIRLADWGVRHQLTPSAIRMLEEIMATEQNGSIRDMLTKKIEQMKFIEKIRQDALARKATPTASNDGTSQFENLRKIEQWGKLIPVAVQDRFLRKIQPILFRRCSGEGCHRESNKELDFILHQSVTRSSKRVNGLKNLQGVLARIDLSQPQASRILTHPPIKDRKGKPCYPFGNAPDSLKDYETFVNWVGSLASQITPEIIQASQESLNQGEQPPSNESPKEQLPLDKPVNGPEQTKQPSEPTVESERTIRPESGLTADGQKYLNRQEEKKKSKEREHSAPVILAPKDAFDPVLFNRRYHPEKFK